VTYLLRDVSVALWAKVKARATSEGRKIRFVIIKMLERYVRQGIE
jgi:hypothetical protein